MENRIEIQKSLVDWYHQVKRDLPWRRTQDPYRIWISEVMLQQTLVETVKGYYARFLEAFPTVEDLAAADDEKLMKMWEGLGYYSRARNLKRAAAIIVADYDGVMPNTKKEIRKLPGIGPYTAGAVLSIAYDLPEAAVDGNVIRVYSRLFGIESPVDLTQTKREIEEIADKMVYEIDPSSYNQSLMELGATVCMPKNPKCLGCPVQEYCSAYASGLQGDIPKKSPKKPKKEVELIAALIERESKFVIMKRPVGGLLPELWSLPALEVDAGSLGQAEAIGACADLIDETYGLAVDMKEVAGTASHVFTHIRWNMTAIRFNWLSGELPEYPISKWITKEQIKDHAFPTAFLKILKSAGLT